jgi:hypothetical protein
MKKTILSGIFVAAIALMAWNFYSTSRSEDLSDLAKANIEALARAVKDPGAEPIGGGSDGGQWVTAYEYQPVTEGMYSEKKFKLTNSTHCGSVKMYNPPLNGTCYLTMPDYN